MARIKRVTLALMFAGGLAVATPSMAYADDTNGIGGDCILCWPGLG